MPCNRIIVFLGPSLSRRRAEAVLRADYRPPAAGGDVYRATLEGPCAILVIDGVFEDRPAVFHKEILWAISQGVHVFGAASIGALRAAELDGFGMVGVGEIYRAYRAGGLDRDDAVALIHGPEEFGYPALSCALVDAWAMMAQARRSGVIDDALLAVLNRAAEGIFYKERTYEAILEVAARACGAKLDGLRAWIAENKVSQKAEDTLALLEHVAAVRDGLDAPASPTFRFEWTAMWDRLKRDVDRLEHGISAPELALVAEELRVAGLYEAVKHEALALLLAEERVQECGRRFDDEALRKATPAFRRKHKLFRGDDVARWMAELELDHADYVSMVAEDFYFDEAARRHASRMPDAMLRALRGRGQLGEYRAKARARLQKTGWPDG